jgi:hypothetical protein
VAAVPAASQSENETARQAIELILDSLTKAQARCFRGANTTTRKRNTLQFGLFFPPPLTISIPDRLAQWHWVNLYEEAGYGKLLCPTR